MVKRREIDFTQGPLIRKMIVYALPIIGVNVLQLLFTATDVAMLGIFTNDMAVAAVLYFLYKKTKKRIEAEIANTRVQQSV